MSFFDDWWDEISSWLDGEGEDEAPDDPMGPEDGEDWDGSDWDDPYDDSDCWEWVWDLLPLVDLDGNEVPDTGEGHWENICYV